MNTIARCGESSGLGLTSIARGVGTAMYENSMREGTGREENQCRR